MSFNSIHSQFSCSSEDSTDWSLIHGAEKINYFLILGEKTQLQFIQLVSTVVTLDISFVFLTIFQACEFLRGMVLMSLRVQDENYQPHYNEYFNMRVIKIGKLWGRGWVRSKRRFVKLLFLYNEAQPHLLH